MKIATYEFDVAYDYALADIMKSFSGHGITLVRYEKNGPAGGNQLLVVEARPSDWDQWCTNNYSDEPSTYLVSVKEV